MTVDNPTAMHHAQKRPHKHLLLTHAHSEVNESVDFLEASLSAVTEGAEIEVTSNPRPDMPPEILRKS